MEFKFNLNEITFASFNQLEMKSKQNFKYFFRLHGAVIDPVYNENKNEKQTKQYINYPPNTRTFRGRMKSVNIIQIFVSNL